MPPLTDTQRTTLRTLADTFVPAVERDDDPSGFWARTASDSGVDQAMEGFLDTNVPEPMRAGVLQLLDGFAAHGFNDAPPPAREAILGAVAGSSPEAGAGVHALRQLTLMMHYALPDATGRNPNWDTLGYPGPLAPPPPTPKTIQPIIPEGDELTLEADVVVVGSGAGGGVIAGELAARGKQVVVVEAGGYFNEADFNQFELWAYQNLYWRGGYTPTADGNVSLVAGATLGGGTVVNWMNCVPTPQPVREQWAREFGMDGVDTERFDQHLESVYRRISVNEECCDFNGPHQRMTEGAEALGLHWKRALRNADRDTYDPQSAGHMGYGDQSGSKQSTLKTYLQDAYDRGTRILVRTRAERILVEDGRAAGVEATYDDGEGRTARVTVRAPQVVVACGALETPALLLRSGVGGPAAGDYLRLHPVGAVVGVYGEDQKAWYGATQTAIVDEFANTGDGYGFLIECTHYSTGLLASALPWTSGREHKELMSRAAHIAFLIGIVRDRGHGRVVLDEAGNAAPFYSVTDELDRRHFAEAMATMARIHEAAGAEEIRSLAANGPVWKRGDDLGAFIERIRRIPSGAAGQPTFSAHQMGTARMGTDPATSVADPRGELHDVPGVWIGDTSAFPTPSGGNPMISCMALARRTAEAIAGAGTGRQPA